MSDCAGCAGGIGASGGDPRAVLLERTAICTLCAGGGSAYCPVTSQPVVLYLSGAPCPKRRHPDESGLVRFLGILWFGFPWPLRWVFWWRLRNKGLGRLGDRRAFFAKFPACGCIARLKVLTWQAAEWLRRLRARHA